jgi:hypothetical protein
VGQLVELVVPEARRVEVGPEFERAAVEEVVAPVEAEAEAAVVEQEVE